MLRFTDPLFLRSSIQSLFIAPADKNTLYVTFNHSDDVTEEHLIDMQYSDINEADLHTVSSLGILATCQGYQAVKVFDTRLEFLGDDGGKMVLAEIQRCQ